MNAREIALKALVDIDTNETYINTALKEALSVGDLSSVDKGFVTELIYGVISNKIAIDFIISRYSKVKIKKMTPWVLNILRMGVFQLHFMDKVPPSAACNEAVKLANKYSHRAGSGFVNGVLRAVSRGKDDFEFPKMDDITEELSLEFSYPIWMTKALIKEYGEEKCRKLFEENNKPHGVFIRVNQLKTTEDGLIETLGKEGISCEKTEVKNCLKVVGKLNVENSAAYKDGLYSLQNISSQMAVEALDPNADELIVDMCAAPGGKSCAIAERMGNMGKVFSFDVFSHKVELIKKSAERLGIDIITPKVQDSREKIESLVEKADKVLADVPCSGLGVIHKKPDIKWKRKEEDILELCALQRDILETASSYVKKGGTLVYSTCTILPEENRIRIFEFLKNHSEYKKVSEQQILTTENGESGFYICKMIKE
ncbi:MAG: 16S rRNA (cytosine(967)-C(5))-methyltransferase RsmB [Clostridia bacterium]|nr:16S rRNA (cytosine(967)-C(5))-methyltransferase RsmB [Clostridia bacterium]